MNFTPVTSPGLTTTEPHFHAQAVQIVQAVLETKKLPEILHASDAIVEKTRHAYAQWESQTNPAIHAYAGDVYKGFYASTLDADDIRWAQEHIFILSGLYGVLRPLDRISAYRLEMKAKLAVGEAKDLYSFWGDTIAKLVDERAGGTICILSSDEYAKVVTAHTRSRIVTPVFMDKKPNGVIGTVPIYSKMMRGVMARWIIDNRVDDLVDLCLFQGHGYRYSPERSSADKPVFCRPEMKPLVF
jgi:cytoplasmic iron level regulating protein YaaA (DUF328/UPF0246 family)